MLLSRIVLLPFPYRTGIAPAPFPYRTRTVPVPHPYRYRTVPAQFPYRTRTVPVPFPHNSPTAPVPFPYRSRTIPLPHPYRSRTVPVPFPYHSRPHPYRSCTVLARFPYRSRTVLVPFRHHSRTVFIPFPYRSLGHVAVCAGRSPAHTLPHEHHHFRHQADGPAGWILGNNLHVVAPRRGKVFDRLRGIQAPGWGGGGWVSTRSTEKNKKKVQNERGFYGGYRERSVTSGENPRYYQRTGAFSLADRPHKKRTTTS